MDHQEPQNPYEPVEIPKRIDSLAWRRRQVQFVDRLVVGFAIAFILIVWSVVIALSVIL